MDAVPSSERFASRTNSIASTSSATPYQRGRDSNPHVVWASLALREQSAYTNPALLGLATRKGKESNLPCRRGTGTVLCSLLSCQHLRQDFVCSAHTWALYPQPSH